MEPVGSIMDFHEIYEAYFPKVYHYVYSCLLQREAAEDVTEKVFLSVLENFALQYAGRGTVYSWICTIARNMVRDYFKKAHVRYEIPIDAISEEEARPDMADGSADSLSTPENQMLRSILQKLSPGERDFLELRFGMELRYEEIADLLDISGEAAKKRGWRILEKCRRLAREIS